MRILEFEFNSGSQLFSSRGIVWLVIGLAVVLGQADRFGAMTIV